MRTDRWQKYAIEYLIIHIGSFKGVASIAGFTMMM